MSDIENVDDQTTLGEVFDLVMRKANIEHLIDYYMGSEVDYKTSTVHFLWASTIPVEGLDSLKAAVESSEFSVKLEQLPEEEDSAWLLVVNQEELSDIDAATEVELSGDVDIGTSTTGDVSVDAGTGVDTEELE